MKFSTVSNLVLLLGVAMALLVILRVEPGLLYLVPVVWLPYGMLAWVVAMMGNGKARWLVLGICALCVAVAALMYSENLGGGGTGAETHLVFLAAALAQFIFGLPLLVLALWARGRTGGRGPGA